jgi:5-methylcytosine-specific restriction enzyme A
MPKRRPPKELWKLIRLKIIGRDQYQCLRCKTPVTEKTAHIDHIQSGKRANNQLKHLRVLCRRCHVLRADHKHQGMIAKALADGIIPPNWRTLVWEEDELVISLGEDCRPAPDHWSASDAQPLPADAPAALVAGKARGRSPR